MSNLRANAPNYIHLPNVTMNYASNNGIAPKNLNKNTIRRLAKKQRQLLEKNAKLQIPTEENARVNAMFSSDASKMRKSRKNRKGSKSRKVNKTRKV